MAPSPQVVHRNATGILQVARHDRIAEPRARETRVFRETSDLDGAATRAIALVDGVWQVGIRDVGLVSGIVHDDRSVLVGIVDPCLQLGLRDSCPRRIVGEAQVDERYICIGIGQPGRKAPLSRAGHVLDVAPQPGGSVVRSRAARHHVGVDVDRVHGVAHGNARIGAEDFLDVRAIGFGAIADEHLVGLDQRSARFEIALRDSLAQEVIAQVGSVPAKRRRITHLIDRRMQGFHDGWS